MPMDAKFYEVSENHNVSSEILWRSEDMTDVSQVCILTPWLRGISSLAVNVLTMLNFTLFVLFTFCFIMYMD